MRCGCLSAEDCAITVWCAVLAGRRENAGWRAACPVCHSPRALEWDAPAGAVRWHVFCPCEQATVRNALAGLLGDHLGGRSRRPPPADAAELEELALSGLPGTALKAALLMRAGRSFTEAMDKLGVDRTTRYRVRRLVLSRERR
jgi:hypothetical protein